jgi:hypothetical protein
MKNYRILALSFFFSMFTAFLWGQKEYVIEYSKKNDSFEYFEKVQKGGQTSLKKIRNLQPKEEDQIAVVAKDYNGFSLQPKVIFQNIPYENTSTHSNQFIGVLSKSLIGIDLSFLSEIQAIPLSRGDAELKPEEQEFTDQLEFLESQAMLIQEKWVVQKNLFSLLYNDQKTTSEIKKEAVSIFNQLKDTPNIDWNAIKNAHQRISALSSKKMDTRWQKKLEEINGLQNEWKTIENEHWLDATAIQNIELLLEQAPSSYTQQTSIEELKSSDENPSQSVQFGIAFLQQDPLAHASSTKNENIEYPESDKIVYYNNRAFRDEKGNIASEMCPSCTPIILAEGYFNYQNSAKAMPPIEYTALFKNHPGAYGEWKIYNEKGEIEHHISLQSFQPQIQFSEPASLPLKKGRIELRQKTVLQFGTAIFMNHTFQDRNTYRTFQNASGDSIMISNNSQNNWIPSVGAQMRCLFPSKRLLRTGLNLGVSLNTFSETDVKKINLHLGTELSLTSFPSISLCAGLNACRTSQLLSQYSLDHWYTAKDLYYRDVITADPAFETLTQNIFKWGYFFGLNVNF